MTSPTIISKKVRSPLYTIAYTWIDKDHTDEVSLESITFKPTDTRPVHARLYRWVDESTHTTIVCYKEDEEMLTEYSKDTRRYYKDKSAKALEGKI